MLVPHRAAAARVEPGRGLVEEDHLRRADQRHRQVEAAAHPARVGRHRACPPRRRDRTGRAARRRELRPAARPRWFRSAISRRFSSPVSSSSTAENWPVTPIAARTPSGSSAHVVAGDLQLAGVGGDQRRQDPHDRRLAGAVRAEQREDRSLARRRGRRRRARPFRRTTCGRRSSRSPVDVRTGHRLRCPGRSAGSSPDATSVARRASHSCSSFGICSTQEVGECRHLQQHGAPLRGGVAAAPRGPPAPARPAPRTPRRPCPSTAASSGRCGRGPSARRPRASGEPHAIVSRTLTAPAIALRLASSASASSPMRLLGRIADRRDSRSAARPSAETR